MQYLLMIHSNESGEHVPQPEDVERIIEAVEKFDADLTAEGRNIGSIRLRPATSARIIRSRSKKVMVTDGPFAETKEQLGGVYIIEAENADEAVQIAKKLPMNHFGSVEVRAIAGIDIRKTIFEQHG